jgi:hypothetical protein
MTVCARATNQPSKAGTGGGQKFQHTSLAAGGGGRLSALGTDNVLAGTSTGDDLWDDGAVVRGARAWATGRSSAKRVGMGGETEENDGMS